MIGLDSNVIVRLLVADDPAQTARADSFVAREFASSGPLLANFVALAETLWVLESTYGFDKRAIVDAIKWLLRSKEIAVEDTRVVDAALLKYERSGADFADTLIGEINRARGCTATGTFDKKAAKLDGFVLVR